MNELEVKHEDVRAVLSYEAASNVVILRLWRGNNFFKADELVMPLRKAVLRLKLPHDYKEFKHPPDRIVLDPDEMETPDA